MRVASKDKEGEGSKAMETVIRVAGEDAGDGEGGKSNGDGATRAIARRRAMAGPIYKIK